MPHKSHIGQSQIIAAGRGQDAPHGAYKIIGQLPQNGAGEFEYRSIAAAISERT
jgi:hypothetical protein